MHLPPTTVFRRLKTTRRCFDGRPIPVRIPNVIKFHVAVHTTQNHTTSLLRCTPNTDFPNVIKFRVAVHTLWEKAIRFRHLDYDSDRAQKLISLSMSQHLSTHNISSKSMQVFLSNLAYRQTDRETKVGMRAKNIYLLCCRR